MWWFFIPAGGLFVVLGIVYFLITIRSPEERRRALGLSVLGSLVSGLFLALLAVGFSVLQRDSARTEDLEARRKQALRLVETALEDTKLTIKGLDELRSGDWRGLERIIHEPPRSFSVLLDSEKFLEFSDAPIRTALFRYSKEFPKRKQPTGAFAAPTPASAPGPNERSQAAAVLDLLYQLLAIQRDRLVSRNSEPVEIHERVDNLIEEFERRKP